MLPPLVESNQSATQIFNTFFNEFSIVSKKENFATIEKSFIGGRNQNTLR
jgi:hypothetical protein